MRANELGQSELELRLQSCDRTLRRTVSRTRSLQPTPGLLVDQVAFGCESSSLSPCRVEPGFELFEQQDLLARVDLCNELVARDTIARRSRELDQSTRHASTHRDEVGRHPRIVLLYVGEALPDLGNDKPGPGTTTAIATMP